MKKTSQPDAALSDFVKKNKIVNLGELLFDYIPGYMFFIKDKARCFVYINQELTDFMGLKNKKEIIGRTDDEFFHSSIEKAYASDDKKVIEDGQVIANRVELITTSQKIICWHVTSKVPLYSADGKICGLFGVTSEFKHNASVSHHVVLGKSIDYIAQNFSEDIKLEEMAKKSGLSVSAFERNFKKCFHLTPMQYLSRYRIHQACNALNQTDTAISEISMNCGFYDQSHFTRTFSKIMQITPAEYRRRYKTA